MKKAVRILSIVAIIAVVVAMSIGFVACDKGDNGYSRHDGQVIRFAAPQGTPALAMLRLKTDNPMLDGTDMEYDVVAPSLISAEMTGKKSDVLIMPINAGANLIRQGADYKLVSVAVDGSLFMVGKKDGSDTLTFDDVKGQKVACIGQGAVPGLVFGYVMAANGIEIITSGEPNENQVFVQYVADATVARTAYLSGEVKYMVVGEPAATQFKNALSLNAEMDIQLAYKNSNSANGNSYPQAGLFVRTALANDTKFMNALFDALAASKTWVNENKAEVSEFASQNLYANATFPAASISRCAINCNRLDETSKTEIITFFKNIMPKDGAGNAINWDGAKDSIF